MVSALLFALGYWTYSQVERSLREIRASMLQSLLDSGVNALRVWINEEIADAQRLARDARVRGAIAALARDPACSGNARAHLEEVMRPLLREGGKLAQYDTPAAMLEAPANDFVAFGHVVCSCWWPELRKSR